MYNFYCICKVLLVYDAINLYLEPTFFFHINAFRAEVKKKKRTIQCQVKFCTLLVIWLTIYVTRVHYFDTKSYKKNNMNFLLKPRDI